MPEAFRVAVGVLEVRRHAGVGLVLDRRQGVEEGQGTVRLRRVGQVQRRLRQVEASLRHAHRLERLRRRLGVDQRVGVGQPHVLGRQDAQPPQHEAGVLPGVDHLRQPVQRRVRVRTTHALDEGADHVEVRVALLVVQHGPPLDRRLGGGPVHPHHARLIRLGGGDGQLQRVQQRAGVAVGDLRQVRQRLLVHRHRDAPEATLRIAQRRLRHAPQIALLQRHQLEHAAARHQRLVHLEERVLGGRTDEGHHPRLDRGEQGVLLGLVEAMDLVDEQQRPAPTSLALRGGRHGLADVLHAGQHRVQRNELRPRRPRDDPRQGGLAGPRRAVEDHAGQPVGLDRPAQQPARPQDVVLADELLQRARPHARRERLAFGLEQRRLRDGRHPCHASSAPRPPRGRANPPTRSP
ncbi:MAG: hypothetical protein U5K81_09225 [Trueperaceae bacterium]|nr:hypothetical protein [Trueperaceae bacterium]